ncbi:MAG: hypothetical protein A2Y40_06335 [Candidatus Margulisbacteria bacterium GWF2_35_9]|nr:MAG: hypothetical protein A2Y40_06335 [Candidatus Margulisbacteria bacterium GWF2_35_9]
MDTKKTLLWITRTAILIALLVAFQWVLNSLTGNQFVVGSAVNLVLIIAATVSGLYSGLTVALISPFMAFLFGIGTPLFQIVPFIALGNIVIVLIWFIIANKLFPETNKYVRFSIALVLGALLKFLTLYLTIVKFAIPTLLNLPEAKVTAISLAFSWPQLVTAMIGGVLAILIIPIIKKAVK